MVSKGHALSRDALIRTLTAYSGITTEDGEVVNSHGTTLVDANLIDRNDFISEKTILIMSGDAKDEDKGATAFDNSDGKITLQGTGFSHQIKAGTIFRVLNISSIEIDVARIEAKLDTVVTAADPKVMGKLQMAVASWDGRLGDGAGSDVLLTATGQAVVVKGVIVVMAAIPDLTDDPWTGISVEDDYATTPHIFIAAADGVKANLTANAQLAWSAEETGVYLAVGRSIQATAIDDDADEDASITIIVLYRAVVSGGYLA
ncbi:unnamed protein product [marine sediment metagenome]|uniref:Uncharacterized protein n=1 Tax=marine sediment metagenome TaxID=412755 RepID=X1QCR7_9ZZZZ